MSQEKLTILHAEVQKVIDAIASKEFKTANNTLVKINDEIEELLDTTTNESFIVELSKYQILLDHLRNKINTSE